MRATLSLVREHEAILRSLALLEQVAQGVVEDRAGAEDDLEWLLNFIRDYADALHHGKEEQLLFPNMRHLPSAAVVRATEDEHPAGRAEVARLRRGLEARRRQEAGAAEGIRDAACTLRKHLCDHINQEDHVVFPMAERHLSEDAKSELKAQMALLEDRLFPGMPEEPLDFVESEPLQLQEVGRGTSKPMWR